MLFIIQMDSKPLLHSNACLSKHRMVWLVSFAGKRSLIERVYKLRKLRNFLKVVAVTVVFGADLKLGSTIVPLTQPDSESKQ